MNYELNSRYFEDVRYKWQIIMIVIGALIFLGGLGGSAGAAIVGLLLLAGGIAWIVLKKKNIVSDSQYDESVYSYLGNTKERALNKLGLDASEVQEIEPIQFSSYRYKGCKKAKKGADDFWRTDVYESITMFFSANEVHCYTLNYNTLEKKQTESTDVYFYSDIVSVSTTSEEAEIGFLNETVNYEAFKLTTAGGTSISIGIKDQDNAQRSINAMRQLLRAKKLQK